MYVERVIKSFVTLATSSSDVKHICASGLCNLADLKELRPRLVEEGVRVELGVVELVEGGSLRVCQLRRQQRGALVRAHTPKALSNCSTTWSNIW